MSYATPLSAVLSTLIKGHSIEARKLSDADRLESAHIDEDGYTVYDFSTNLHHR